jgi:CubicO group peptidase (beta-lactamase class C family)
MRLRTLIIASLIFLATGPPLFLNGKSFAAAGSSQKPSGVDEKVRRVENGLLPRVAIKGQPRQPMTIAERMAHYKVPGLSIAVINNGAIEWARGYGVAEAGGDRAVTAETLFQAASISKPVAAMGALLLVERGKLALDEDVNTKLKSWKVPENEFTKEKKVTLRGLLSHSAGLTVHGFRGYASDETIPTILEVLDGRKPPANSAPVRVDTVPGTKWRYSGGGISVAQLMVMEATSKPFPQFMKEAVLDRIGMKDSTYEQPLPNARAERAATGHRSKGEIVKGKWHAYPEMAAAGLWTTPSDLARFAIELQKSRAGRSNRVLSKEMTLEMLKQQMGDYGLGISVGGAGRAARFSHGGSNEGFRCMMFAYAETGQGAVVMTNGDGGSPLVDEIMRSIAAEYGWPDYLVAERDVARVDPKIFEAYVGEYNVMGVSVSVSSEGGRLYIKAPPFGPERYELYPESEAKYFVTVDDVNFTFTKDADGKITGMLIFPPRGGPMRANKIK